MKQEGRRRQHAYLYRLLACLRYCESILITGCKRITMNKPSEHAQNAVDANVMLLKLPQIAAWQIDHSSAQPYPCCMAELPALQRGAVWKAGQIEVLWDSIFQGFPLGAFLLTPFDTNLGQQSFQSPKKPSAQAIPPTHMKYPDNSRQSRFKRPTV